MNKQELIKFLQDEADLALKDLFPRILYDVEHRFVVGQTVEVQLSEYLTRHSAGVRAAILGTASARLEELGYTVTSYINTDSIQCLGVS